MTRRPVLSGLAVAGALALSAALAGCSSSGPVAEAAQHGHTGIPSLSLPAAHASSAAHGAVSRISVRYANLFVHKGAAGPALDLYEGQTGERGAILVRNLAYGAVSSYAHPHLEANQLDKSQGLVTLPIYAVPTGEDPLKQPDDVKGLSSLADDGSHPQLTMLMQGEKDTDEAGPLGGLSFSNRMEKGTFNGKTAPDIPPAGTTELLADDTSVTTYPTLIGSVYLMVDSDCKAPANGDPNQPDLPDIFAAQDATPKSAFAVFPEAAGSHQVAVATTDIHSNLTCAQLTQRQGQTTTTLADGQQVEVYVYGPSATDLHVVFAPVSA